MSTSNLRVKMQKNLLPPKHYLDSQPISNEIASVVSNSRKNIENILDRKDKRMFVIVGPCSIHDEVSCLDYAKRLKKLSDEVNNTLLIVMRVYFEKPRTTVGWKGLINDPNLDGTYDIENGLKRARNFFIEVNNLGLGCGTEFLDPISPQYYADLVSWGAIGARTTESQTHRQMASGLSMPIGFKNSTTGDCQIAADAIVSCSSEHSFLGIDDVGKASIIHTTGNKYGHIILRGGKVPNYEAGHVKEATELLTDNSLPKNIVIDCSHGNSNKDHKKQPIVFENIINQRINGNKNIVGVMIESHINAGNQKLNNPADLDYGVSITDACVDWNTTEKILLDAHKKLSK